MSRLVNNNFNRDTKLDPAPINSKFQEVATAVNGQVDENNIRDSSIDSSNFDTQTTNGKAGIQLVYFDNTSVGTSGGGGTNVTRSSLSTPVAQPGNWNIGSLTLAENDIIRVYWNGTFRRYYNGGGFSNIAEMRDHFFAQYLEWDFNGAGFAPVPGQTNFNNTTFDTLKTGARVSNTRASSLFHYAVIVDDGSTVANVAPTDAAPASSSDSILKSDFVAKTSNSIHSTSGSWTHKVTALQAGTRTIQLKVVTQGPVTPYYDATIGSESNWLVHSSAANIAAIDPSITFQRTFMVFMVMRSK